jgi:hypothetical protein
VLTCGSRCSGTTRPARAARRPSADALVTALTPPVAKLLAAPPVKEANGAANGHAAERVRRVGVRAPRDDLLCSHTGRGGSLTPTPSPSPRPAAQTAVVAAAAPYAFSFPVARTALVMIDFQRDFMEPGGFGASLGNPVELLQARRGPARAPAP